jgi:hypothetical protein
MRLRLLALVLLSAGCAANGSAELPIGPGAPNTPQVPAPVDFPVTAVPRPIVLVGPPLEWVTTVGSEDEKVTAGNGRFSFTGAEPATPVTTAVSLPEGVVTFPLIGVRDAVAAMSADAREGAALELVSVDLTTAQFRSDRGPVELPAWRFQTSYGSVAAWPAITPDAFWKFGEVGYAMHHATTADGLELTVELPAPAPPCPGEAETVVEPVVVEETTYVTVGVRTVSGGPGHCARDAMYRGRPYTVRLKQPLGNRLLVDENNGIIPVAPQQ